MLASTMYPSEIREIKDPKRRREVYINNTLRNNLQDSLGARIDAGIELTEDEISELVDLLGKRCKVRTKNRIKWALMGCPDNIDNPGIFRRVLFNDGGRFVSYCAGQSYPDEIRTVRQCLIGR
jgi:hypothetical protein